MSTEHETVYEARYGYQVPRGTILVALGLFFAIGSLLTVPLMWDTYWWLFLTGGLALLALLTVAPSKRHGAFVAVSVILAVTFWVAVIGVFQVEALDYPPPGLGTATIGSILV